MQYSVQCKVLDALLSNVIPVALHINFLQILSISLGKYPLVYAAAKLQSTAHLLCLLSSPAILVLNVIFVQNTLSLFLHWQSTVVL